MSNTKSTRKAAKKAANAVKRAAIYVRVSTEKQAKTKSGKGKEAEAEEKESPQAQERDCRALAERQGYIVTAVYRDTDKYRVGKKLVEPSGTRADRPALRRMLTDARAGLFDVILAWREDRLYRSYRPMLDVLDCLEETGLDIELAKETFDKNLAPVKAWAARMELQAKHDRQMMGVAGKLASGKGLPNSVPYGYKCVNGIYDIEPTEAEWVKHVWAWRDEGLGWTEIRQRLIAGGAPQRRGGKYAWHPNLLHMLFAKDCYHTGVMRWSWDGGTYEVPVPVLIAPELAARVIERKQQYNM